MKNLWIDKMADNGFKINWGTILVGWLPMGGLPKKIANVDVIETAIEVCSVSQCEDLVTQLSLLDSANTEEITQCLFCLSDNNLVEFEIRKWRWILLKTLLEGYDVDNVDEVEALSDLTDFWMKFDYPTEIPYSPQALTHVDPINYYSKENWVNQYMINKKWLVEEEKFILTSDLKSIKFDT